MSLLRTNQPGNLPGGIAVNDGPGPVFVASGDVLAADGRGNTRWAASQVINAAAPTGSAALDTANLQAAISALGAAGGTIRLPAGSYQLNATLNLDGTDSVRLEGAGSPSAGASAATEITYTPAAGAAISARSSFGFALQGIQLLYNNAAYAGNLIDLSHSALATDSAYWQITDCYIGGSGASGATLLYLNQAIAGRIRNCVFAAAAYHIIGQAAGGYSNGVDVADCSFLQAGTMPIRNPGNAWRIDSCVFEGTAAGVAAALAWDAGIISQGLQFSGNWCGDVNKTQYWINLTTACSGIVIIGNYFGDANAAIQVTAAVAGLVVIGNKFDAGNYGISVGAAGRDWIVAANDSSTVTNFLMSMAAAAPPRSLIIDDKAGTADSYGLMRAVPGAVSDASFPGTPPDNTLAVDSTDKRLYIRTGGTWHYAALT